MSDPLPPQPLDYQSADLKPRNPPASRLPMLVLLALGATAAFFACYAASLNHRHGEFSPRAKCASNLHQIGLGIWLYANDHNGVYPDSLQTVAAAEQLTPNVFVCPSASDEPSTAPTTQGQMDDLAVPGHCSYIYLGAGLTTATVLPNQVLAYEPLTNHKNDGMNVLFGDGHAEWIEMSRATKILAALKAATRPVILPP